MKGSLSVNATATPVITINQNLSGVNVAALTKDAANLDTLEGKGNVGMKLAMRGNTVGAMKKSLSGNLSLAIVNGSFKGVNIAKTLRMFRSSGTAQTLAATQTEKTDFSELKASFKIRNGVAHNDDLLLKSPLLRMAGQDDIDIGNNTIEYLAKATLSMTLEGQGGKDRVGGFTVPLRIGGPLSAPSYTLDFGAMVIEAVRQKVESTLIDKLKGFVKGLFK